MKFKLIKAFITSTVSLVFFAGFIFFFCFSSEKRSPCSCSSDQEFSIGLGMPNIIENLKHRNREEDIYCFSRFMCDTNSVNLTIIPVDVIIISLFSYVLSIFLINRALNKIYKKKYLSGNSQTS